MQKPADTLAWRCRQACDSMHVKFMVASRPHPDQGPRERVMYTIIYIYTYAYVLVPTAPLEFSVSACSLRGIVNQISIYSAFPDT